MAMNRRNVLIGLGAVAAGGGAVLGTGAFSQVEASRTVTVDTVGDSDAFLGVSVKGDYATDGSSGNAVQIDLEGSSASDGFNDDAITDVNGILTLSNNAADGNSITVGFDDGTGSQTASKTVVVETDGSNNVLTEVEFNLASDDGNGSKSLSTTSDTVDVNATVRTGSETTESSSTSDKTEGTLTLIAN